VGEDVLVALFVGKFISKKRPQDLIHALAHLQRRGNNSIGVFVGAGELEHALHQESKRLNVTVRFEGFRNQTELPRYYALADVLVLPSDGGETWGLVVNEAMACGLPAVVSDAVGCAPDLIDQGKTGFVFPVADSGSLAQRMESLLDLKLRGHDFRPALEEKMKAYSVEAAVSGTLKAIHALAPGV
jgi:glycosyltransferase involved in cell wall biosynthesis